MLVWFTCHCAQRGNKKGGGGHAVPSESAERERGKKRGEREENAHDQGAVIDVGGILVVVLPLARLEVLVSRIGVVSSMRST